MVDDVDPMMSARLVLGGEAPASLAGDSVLVACGQSGGWRLQGGMWTR